MEVNKLSDDEIKYELAIRGVRCIENTDDMRTVLRTLLKYDPGRHVECNFNPSSEIDICIRKAQHLKTLVDSISGTRFEDSYRTADTKLSHLLGRIDRIICENNEVLRKKRSVLLKTVLYLMREMENKVTGDVPFQPSEHRSSEGSVKSGMASTASGMASTVSSSTIKEDSGTEIFCHQGVALKNPKYDRNTDSLPTGTLTVVQYKTGKWLEWRQTDVSFESDNTDAEWDLVDAVTKRRTVSGSSVAENVGSHIMLRMAMADLRSYKIKHHGRQVSLMYRDGRHYSFLFQCGNADTFIHALRAVLNTRRAGHSKNSYIVVNEREESTSLNRSFNELNLFPDQGQKYVWNFVRNLQNRPYETTMQTFSKLTDVFLYRPPEQRPLDEEVVELLTKSLHVETSDTSLDSDFTLVDSKIALPPRSVVCRAKSLTKQHWNNILDSEGRITDPEMVKAIIFKGGIEEDIRPEVWKYLLQYYPWNYTHAECERLRKYKTEEYFTMKNQWQSMTPVQEDRFSAFRERKSLIEKDVNRTDRTMPYFSGDNNSNLETLSNILMTYVMYNFDLGYVQGMSDLLAPILFLLNDEVDSFWCFASFMDRVYTNFDLDQAGMKEQLSQLYSLLRVAVPDLAVYLEKHESANMFFCFRWLLVLFKREFSYSETMTLWEVLWTDLPCKNFHLIVCVAILEMEKSELMKPGNGFTEILKYVNELSQRMNLDDILNVAEGIYYQLKEVKDKLPLAVQRIVGFAPPPVEIESDNSDDDYSPISASQPSVSQVSPRAPTPPIRTSSSPADDDDIERVYMRPHSGNIGFEGFEKAIGLNYY